MGQLRSVFEQSQPSVPPPRRGPSGGMGDLGRSRQRAEQPSRQSGIYLVTHHGIVEGIDANAAASFNVPFQVFTGRTSAASQYVGTFADMRPKATQELDRIRSLLADGLLRDARLVIEEALKKFPTDESLFALSKLTTLQKAVRVEEKFAPRHREFQWLEEHHSKYKGKWVALLGSNLVASGDTMKQVLDTVHAAHLEGTPLIHKVR